MAEACGLKKKNSDGFHGQSMMQVDDCFCLLHGVHAAQHLVALQEIDEAASDQTRVLIKFNMTTRIALGSSSMDACRGPEYGFLEKLVCILDCKSGG